MRILFVYSCIDPRGIGFAQIHIGLSSVAAVLKAEGHTTRLVVICSETPRSSRRSLESTIAEYDPELIAFTCVSPQYSFVADMARIIKARWPDKFLLIGGTHVTMNPEQTLAAAFDALCIGEGELPSVELARQLAAGQSPQGIQNLWIRRRDGTVERNLLRPFLQDLDRLPVIEREMWAPWVRKEALEHHVVLLGRGCPFECTYCCNQALRKMTSGAYVRYRSAENICAEIRLLKEQSPEIRDVYLQVETIGLNREWLFELCRQLQALNATLPTPITFMCNLRVAPKYADEEVFSALERANVGAVEIGFESGSERLRREVLRRNYTNDEFLQVVALVRKHGMKLRIYNMVGLPGETLADHMETVRINHICNPDWSVISIFHPYPGTPLYEMAREKGLLDGIEDLNFDLERSKAALDLPGFSRRQIQHAHDWFDFRIYRGHRPLSFRVRKVIRNLIGSQLLLYLLFLRLLPLWHAIQERRER
jgi:anaerobic magnesium-protoporphyrin IX monomethyl ester cyclase